MEDLRFYDFEHNFLGIVPDIEEAVWELKFNGVGTFETSIPADAKICTDLVEKDYLVVIQGTKQAIITEKHIEGNRLTLFGRTMNFILTKRVVKPFDIEEASVEYKAINLVTNLMTKYFPEIKVETPDFDEEIGMYKLVLHDLEEVVCDILDKIGAGHKVYFDVKNKKWVLQFLKKNTTSRLFSEENMNIYDTAYKEGVLDYANCGYYARFIRDCGDWDAESNIPPLSMGQESNLGKLYRVSESGRQFLIDYKKGEYIACTNENGNFEKTDYITEFYLQIDTDKTGLYRWEAILSGSSRKEAEKSLKTKNKECKINAKINNVKFEQDYNLGDVVRLQKKIGDRIIDVQRYVSSVRIWNNSRECGERPNFKEV